MKKLKFNYIIHQDNQTGRWVLKLYAGYNCRTAIWFNKYIEALQAVEWLQLDKSRGIDKSGVAS